VRLASSFALALVATTAAAQLSEGELHPVEPYRPNILVILADDLGLDAFEPSASSLGWSAPCSFASDIPCLPNVERILERGVSFRQAWANPSCSPTRASLLTGRYPMNTGIGKPISSVPGTPNYTSLSNAEVLIPELLASRGYVSGAFGKWHLSGTDDAEVVGLEPCSIEGAPWLNGFSYFEGSFHHVPAGEYCSTSRKISAVPDASACGTATSRGPLGTHLYTGTFQDAKDWIQAREGTGQRWMCYLAPQGPFEHNVTPPAGVWGEPSCFPSTVGACGVGGVALDNYRARLQYIDEQIGEVLDLIGGGQWWLSTVVFFIGDNGTPVNVLSPPFAAGSKGKGTLHEGGVRVPFVVGGAEIVRRGEVDEMIHVADVFPTIAGLLRCGQPAGVDGKNFAPYLRTKVSSGPRDFLFAEYWDNSTQTCGLKRSYAYRKVLGGVTYKLIWQSAGTCITRHLFDLDADPCETVDLAGDLAYDAELVTLVNALEAQLGCSLSGPFCP